MNIYALKGHKVRVTEASATNGYRNDADKVKRYLEIGEIYTVLTTHVDTYHSSVILEQKPKIVFNAVNFKCVFEQSDEDNRKHHDWKRFNPGRQITH